MQKIRYGLIALSILLCSATTAPAQLSIGIGLPNVSIGINLPLFPELVPVPGYPVYYAPGVDSNYFFYDGMYWVYQNDNWYASSWYNGPWSFVERDAVPLYVLRIPVRYYRQPPPYFRGWQSNAPPRWGQHWGRGWEQRHSGWNRWNRASAPARAPQPVYQRQYSGDRYPRVEQQHELRDRSYRYQPRDKAVRQHFKQRIEQKAPVPAPAQRGRQEEQEMKGRGHQQPQPQQVAPHQQPQPRQVVPQQQNAPVDPRQQHQQRGGENNQRPNADHAAPQQRQAPRAQEQEQKSHDRGEQQDRGRGRGQGQDKDDDRGRGRDK